MAQAHNLRRGRGDRALSEEDFMPTRAASSEPDVAASALGAKLSRIFGAPTEGD